MKKIIGGVSKSFRHPTLRLSIMAIFVGLFASAVGTIVTYTYQKKSKATLLLSNDIIAQATGNVIGHTENYLKPIIRITELSRHVKGVDSPTPDPFIKPMTDFFLDTLKVHPELYSFYIGYANGDFLQFISLPPDSTYRETKKGRLPAKAIYARRLLKKNTSTAHWTYMDKTGRKLDEEILTNVKYDPRKRPWYSGTREKGGRYWTDPYVFSSIHKLGITAGFPLLDSFGRTYGVVGSDLILGKMSAFLKTLKVGKNGLVFIFNVRGKLIAYPDDKKLLNFKDGKLSPVSAYKIDDPRVSFAMAERDRLGSDNFNFLIGGQEYIASFKRLPRDLGRVWFVGIVVPVDDFIGSLKKANREILILSLLISLIAMYAIWKISWRVSKPISQLALETMKIQDFKFDDPINVTSRIQEIDNLSVNLDKMRSTIHSFSHYIPKSLVMELVKSGADIEVGGDRRELTIMFSDAENFSAMAEKMPAEELLIYMSSYLEVITKQIIENQGTIDKYIGDSVMALWGAPTRDVGHAAHACLAALKCRKAVHAFNVQATANGYPILKTRFGIHTGDVAVGNMGSSDRLDYTAVGDSVNVASRLENLNKLYETEIIVSNDTVKAAGPDFIFIPFDQVTVKEKSKNTSISLLLGKPTGEFSVTQMQLAFYKKFSQGYQAYLKQNWDEAINVFNWLSNNNKKMALPAIYLKRCKLLKNNPPAKDWDGVMRADQK